MKNDFNNDDQRFRIAHREAVIGIILVLINFLWWYGFGYGLGSDKVENYTYILGFPAWFFYSCIAGTVVIILLVVVSVKYLFKDIPFEGDEGDHK
ncbi:YhdT family protein [Bacillus sp. DNRA2]|uniref:YhdT family protein n=1 Tax=Bacillus sp. DNRA2 TaxID=2723053 RepID=UPI00145E72AF|nr:YhdT family protein [Bacillus sp. DNRA2]NMD71348.1 YhdT family protein [Bacillus sp. DNRA2]